MDGAALLAAGDLAGAVEAFDRVLSASPRDTVSIVGRARCAVRRGEADAVTRVRAARAIAPADADLALLEAEAEFAAGEPDAGHRLAMLVQRNPGWVAGHRQQIALALESGHEKTAFRALIAAINATPTNGGLWNLLIDLQAGAGLYAMAADSAARARAAGFADPMLDLIEATHAGRAGDLDRSGRLLVRVPVGTPGRTQLEVRHALRMGDLASADRLLEAERARAPDDLAMWALTELVWRANGDPRSEWLVGQKGLMRTVALGWDHEALDGLAARLRLLHRARAQPVGQSVRGGTQTRGRLFDRADPFLAHLAADLQRSVDAHWTALPAVDPLHPLFRHRHRSIGVDGGWSVRLGRAGHHSSHIHAAGLLSSAFYVSLPPLDDVAQEGWLELGRPPDDLRLPLQPLRTIKPIVGTLVLFPSFLYHGTRPMTGGERLTVAFDAA